MEATTFTKALEEGIDELASEFKQRPFNFYTETDMHLQLYAILQAKYVFRCMTNTGDHINLIHTEFPTLSRYRKDEQGFFNLDHKGVRGAYDLVIWDPSYLAKTLDNLAMWRPRFGEAARPHLMAAIECKLYEGMGRYKANVHNDLVKLNDSKDSIQNKYMIHFVRNMLYAKSAPHYFDKLIEEIKNSVRSSGIKVRYVEIRKGAEPIDEWIE